MKKYNKKDWFMMFLAPDGGDGAVAAMGDVGGDDDTGGDDDIDSDDDTGGDDTDGDDDTGGNDDSSGSTGTSTPPLDATAMAAAFASSLKDAGFVPPTPGDNKPPAKDLTPEEMDKMLNVWNPDAAFYEKFDNLETRNEAILSMRDGMLKHFDTVSQIRLNAMEEKIREQYAPVMEAQQRQEGEQRQSRFDTAYPQLAKPELGALIGAVSQKITQEGVKFNTETEMFARVAKDMEAVIQSTNPEFKLTPAGAGKPKSNKIPVTSGGGGGGGGDNKPKTGGAGKNKALSVLGDVV